MLAWLLHQKGSTEPVAFLSLLPLVILVILGVAQLAAYGYATVAIEAAARDAVRAASVGASADSQVSMVSKATFVGMSATPPPTCNASRDMVTVTVRGTAAPLLPVLGNLLVIERRVELPTEGPCRF